MRTYAPGSKERTNIEKALKELHAEPTMEIPLVINGKEVRGLGGDAIAQSNPSFHSKQLCKVTPASVEQVRDAIKGCLKAKEQWESMPFVDRAAVFLKAADLLASDKHRYRVLSATMLGQGKNIWQAEIDAACELIDFLRFNAMYADEIYRVQPSNAAGVWNTVEYRALEGFVLAVSPFNFTAIAGNLTCAPALMGNGVIWKPSMKSLLSNYLVYKILLEAGLPPGVIQFVPFDHSAISACLESKDFAALHFTGSTDVFRDLWMKFGANISHYKTFPRLVGETGGKNMHFVHPSADIPNAVMQTVRAAFEYQGQKCSACSRAYVPESQWPEFKKLLIDTIRKIKYGSVMDPKNFMGPVIDRVAFDRIKKFIQSTVGAQILIGGEFDDSEGYFISPTVLQITDPMHEVMTKEIFGPVLAVYVYPDSDLEKTMEMAANTSQYALTGAIFARDRSAIRLAHNAFRHAAGNFYINDKCTGAIVGQQPFGGSRASGTNDKAGAAANLMRWTSMRAIKESFVGIDSFEYPSNKV